MSASAWTTWAHDVWPGLTDADISTLLWQCTNYPLGTIDEVEREFIALRDQSGGDVLRALEMVAKEKETG